MTKRTRQQKLLYYTSPRFYQKVLNQLEEVEEKVCFLLAKDEHFRNCDNCLLFHYWQNVDNIYTHLLFRFKDERHKCTSAETITRCRRYIQNTLGLWLPTDPEVIKRRKIKELAIREWVITKGRI